MRNAFFCSLFRIIFLSFLTLAIFFNLAFSSEVMNENSTQLFKEHLSQMQRFYKRPFVIKFIGDSKDAAQYDEYFLYGVIYKMNSCFELLDELEQETNAEKKSKLLKNYRTLVLEYTQNYNQNIRPRLLGGSELMNIMNREYEKADALLTKLHGLLINQILETQLTIRE